MYVVGGCFGEGDRRDRVGIKFLGQKVWPKIGNRERGAQKRG